MAYLKHSLGKTFYIKKGRGNIPLVCLHGGPGSGCRGQFPLLELATDREVLLYDQLGCGKSSKTLKNKWTMKTFVEELEVLTKKFGFEQFYLFGTSCGSTLALEYYSKYPKRVKGIIFQSPFFSTKDWQKDALKLIKKMKGKNKEILLRTLAGAAVTDEEFDRATFEYYVRHVYRNRKRLSAFWTSKSNKRGKAIYHYMWGKSEHHVTGTLLSYEGGKKLRAIKVPVMIVCGEHDEATPRSCKKYTKQIRGAKFKVIRGASHAICGEKPKQLRAVINKFLNSKNG
jgi:proline iminopeptidase